jgi:hypothetical protein
MSTGVPVGVGLLLIQPGIVVVRRSWGILNLVADDAALVGRPAGRGATRRTPLAGCLRSHYVTCSKTVTLYFY